MWVLHDPYFVVEETEVQPQQAGALGGLRGGWELSSRPLRGALLELSASVQKELCMVPNRENLKYLRSLFFFILSYFSERVFNV